MKRRSPIITRMLFLAAMYGAAVSAITALTMIAVISLLILNEIFTDTLEQYYVMFVLFLSSLVGSVIARIKSREGEMTACILCAMLFILMMTVLSVLVFNGPAYGVFPKCLMIICGSSLVMLRKTKRKRGLDYKKYKIRNG